MSGIPPTGLPRLRLPLQCAIAWRRESQGWPHVQGAGWPSLRAVARPPGVGLGLLGAATEVF